MEYQLIIEKLLKRSESGINELSNKYGKQCKIIANRVLQNEQDAEECVNDALLVAWNTIPPKKPNPLPAYIYRITKTYLLKSIMPTQQRKRTITMTWC